MADFVDQRSVIVADVAKHVVEGSAGVDFVVSGSFVVAKESV